MKKIFSAIPMLLIVTSCHAQKTYQTETGFIQLAGRFNNENVLAESKHLHLLLNYDNAQFQMQLAIPTILSGSDSLNAYLKKPSNDSLILFSGKMDIDYVQTKNHPKQQFKVQGIMKLNKKERPFQFTGTLEHLNGSQASCQLSGNFTLSLRDFGINTNKDESLVNVRFNEIIINRLVTQ